MDDETDSAESDSESNGSSSDFNLDILRNDNEDWAEWLDDPWPSSTVRLGRFVRRNISDMYASCYEALVGRDWDSDM